MVELPIETDWFYQLNDLIANAIGSSGACAVVQALCMLEREARGMFLYLPCQNLATERGGAPVTDMDVLSVVDGQFIIGEVKSVATGFQEPEVSKAVELAKELRPDQLVFAAPGDDWPNDVEAWVSAASQTLASHGIKSRALRMSW